MNNTLLVIIAVLACVTLVNAQREPSRIVPAAAIVRTLDPFTSNLECDFSPPSAGAPGNCSTRLTVANPAIVGGGEELFIEANSTRYGFPVGGTSAFISTSIGGSSNTWYTSFPISTGGITELTLDGIGPTNDPNFVDFNPGIQYDLTTNNAYAFYIAWNSEFTNTLSFTVFDQAGNIAIRNMTIFSTPLGLIFDYIIEYTDFNLPNGTADFTDTGALDLFLYVQPATDANMYFFDTVVHVISGTAFFDCNDNCIVDPSENVITNGVVELRSGGVVVQTTQTNNVGFYSFNTPPGSYQVCLPNFSGSTFSCPSSNCLTVNVASPPTDPANDDFRFTDSFNFLYPNNDFGISPVSSLFAPPPTTITCGAQTSPGFIGTATVQSACGGATATPTFTDNTSPLCTSGSSRLITRTWTANLNGVISSSVQTITVQDNQPPSIFNVPTPRTISCLACTSTAAQCLGFPDASDDCSTPTIVSSTQYTPSCQTVLLRTFTATDGCGKTQTAQQTVTVIDELAPVFSSVPTATTTDCSTGPGGVQGTALASDECNNGVTVSPAAVSQTGIQCGSYQRTWTATDSCGNSRTATQLVTVQDNTQPQIFVPGPTTISCDSGGNINDAGTATYFDACASGSALLTGVTSVPVSGNSNCGVINRIFTAYDGCTQTVTRTQTITITDPSPPVFIFPPGYASVTTINCSQSTSTNPPSVTASDDCSGVTSVIFGAGPISGNACNSQFTRTWTATNGCGQPTVTNQIVNISDNTPPTLQIPGPITLQCNENSSPTGRAGTATGTDTCSNPVIVDFSDTAPGVCTYTIRRTWTAADACSNAATPQVQIITITDSSPPQFQNFPPNTSIGCLASRSTAILGFPGASDNCNGASVTFGDVDSQAACPTSIQVTRTFTATDGCGNPTSSVQIINILDDQPPQISAPPSLILNCEDNFQAPPLQSATVGFVCGETGTPTYRDDISGSCPIVVTRTWSVRDSCGMQTATAIQTITLNDNTAPNFVQSSLPPSPITISCADDLPSYNIVGTDNCDPNPTVTELPQTSRPDGNPVGLCPANTIITRTWILQDSCGNPTTTQQTVIVDNTPVDPCTPVTCIPQPCDDSTCPNQSCECCRGEALPCSPVNCQASPCTPVDCEPVPCSGCDFPYEFTTCQPKICPPQYIYIDDDDAAAMNRGPVSNVKKANNFPGVSGATSVLVSSLLLVAALASIFVALF